MRNVPAHVAIGLSTAIGGGSLIAFFVFLYAGHLNLVQLGLSDEGALLFDAGLSLCFFLQHSGMVRQAFRRLVGRLFPDAYSGAVYAISSGLVLFPAIVFWQGTADGFTLQGWTRILSRVIFLLPLAGFFWTAKSLRGIDALGIKAILADLRGRKPRPAPFTVNGPYRLVRHPLYLFSLIMIWSCPDLTTDRLLFNVLWSLWIVVGTVWEERDLVREFGDAYREYQRNVPMLLPIKVFRNQRASL
jgi:protein-S-isoprenylcysteine O-methyltransferase Ste14